MTMIVDSNFVIGLLDKDDKHHPKIVAFMSRLPRERLVLPTPTLVEIAHFLQTKIGHYQMRQFIGQFDVNLFKPEPLQESDIPRIYEILEEYADNKLDFVDVSIVALAERLNISKVLTFDRRDFGVIWPFRVIRPSHCDSFEILP